MPHNLRVLAVDPGFGRAGVAVIERHSGHDILLYSHCIITLSASPFVERLQHVTSEVKSVINTYTPNLFALERLYFETNKKTAMQVAEVRGALLSLASEHKLSILEYTPLQVKVAVTGVGNCGKREIMRMIPRLIALPDDRKRLDDEYDAIAIGLTALASYRP